MTAPQDTIVALTSTQRTCTLAYLVAALEYPDATVTLSDFDAAVVFARSVYPDAAVNVRAVA